MRRRGPVESFRSGTHELFEIEVVDILEELFLALLIDFKQFSLDLGPIPGLVYFVG